MTSIIVAATLLSGVGFYAERDPASGIDEFHGVDADVAAGPGGLVDVLMRGARGQSEQAILPDLYFARSRDFGHTWEVQTGFTDTTDRVSIRRPLVEMGQTETCLVWSEFHLTMPEDHYRLNVAYVLPDGRITSPERLDDGSHTQLITVIDLNRTAAGGYQLVYKVGNSRWHVLAGDRFNGWHQVQRVIADSVRIGDYWASERGPALAASATPDGVDLWIAKPRRGTWTGPMRVPNTHGDGERLESLRVAEADGILGVATMTVRPHVAEITFRFSTDGGENWSAPEVIARTTAFGTPTIAELHVDDSIWYVTYSWWFGPYRVDLRCSSAPSGRGWTAPRRVNTEIGLLTESRRSNMDAFDDDAYVVWIRQTPTFDKSVRFRTTSPRSVPGLDTRELLLASTFPNPVPLGGARLTLDLLQPASIVVELFNVRGQLELRRVLGPLSTGRHVMPWDGRSDRRWRLQPGVYFWNIEATHAGVQSTTTERVVVHE